MRSATALEDGSTDRLLRDYPPPGTSPSPIDAPSSGVLSTFLPYVKSVWPALAAKLGSSQEESSPSAPNKSSDAEQLELQDTDDGDDYTSHDARFAGRTLIEKKKLIIQREINKQGFGKYQQWIWGLCGLGYFLDLLWAQAISLAVVPMQNEFGFSEDEAAHLFSVWSAGLAAGAFIFGAVVDIIGRYWAFNLTIFTASVFGLSIGGADSYQTAMALAFFNGFGIGGNIPIDTTICMEFLPENRRDLLPLLSIFQPLGVMVTTALAFGFIRKFNCLTDEQKSCASSSGLSPPDCVPACSAASGGYCCTKRDNMGWRYLLFTLGALTLTMFFARFLLFTFQESPMWLVSKKKDHLAINALRYIADFNKNPTNLTLQRLHDLDRIEASETQVDPEEVVVPPSDAKRNIWKRFFRRLKFRKRNIPWERFGPCRKGLQYVAAELSNYWRDFRGLFKTWPDTHLVVIIWLIYAFNFWGFSIVGALLPKIVAEKNQEDGIGLSQTYKDYLIIFSPGILGVLVGVWAYHLPGRGRQGVMLISAIGYCLTLFMFTVSTTRARNVTINTLEYFFQSMFNSILYAWTPEAFPAHIRGTASTWASGWGRAFQAFMPIAGGKLLNKLNGNGPLILAGSGVAAMVVSVVLIPPRAFRPELSRGM